MMTMDQHLPEKASTGAAEPSLVAVLWSGVADWATTCADYYAASTTYEELSRLSNAELQRRGLSRESLARAVIDACERRD